MEFIMEVCQSKLSIINCLNYSLFIHRLTAIIHRQLSAVKSVHFWIIYPPSIWISDLPPLSALQIVDRYQYMKPLPLSQPNQESPALQAQGISSNELARSIIRNSLLGRKKQLDANMLDLKTKKLFNPEKFSTYLVNELQRSSELGIRASIDLLVSISESSRQANVSDNRTKSIATGFTQYWAKQPKMKKEDFDELLHRYFGLLVSMSDPVASYIAGLGPKSKRGVLEAVRQVLVFGDRTCDNGCRCCNLIHYSNLYSDLKMKDLIHMAQMARFEDIVKFFKRPEGGLLKQLCEGYIMSKLPNQTKDVKKMVTSLKLNPFDYPHYIKALNKKCLRHLFNTEQIYVTELKVKGRPDIIQCLIEELIESRRCKEAIHFINKFKVERFYPFRGSNQKYQPNLLNYHDDFVPTQLIIDRVLKRQSEEYLSMKDFNLRKEATKFVGSQEWASSAREIYEALDAIRIGIDSENKPVFNAHEVMKVSILQIAPEVWIDKQGRASIPRVYILDVDSLGDNAEFKDWFFKLTHSYSGQIVGHSTKVDLLEILKQLEIPQAIKANLVDVAEEYKKMNKEDSKSSLEHLCKKLMQKKLSKFEQCSGWHNRPLRLAQLHYAALDAVVPLKIYQHLLKTGPTLLDIK